MACPECKAWKEEAERRRYCRDCLEHINDLKIALEKYGKHICEDEKNCCPLALRACCCDSCIEKRKQKGIHNKCTCGFEEALNG